MTVAVRLMVAYDGSPSAATAVAAATRLFPAAEALVATVPRQTTMHAGTALPVLPGLPPTAVQDAIDELGAEAGKQASETAQQAVEQARAQGVRAEVAPIRPRGPAWAALLEGAHELGADLLVCGARGRGAFARALLGSTSSSLLHHTDVPLLVVPDGAGRLDGPVVAAYDGSDGAKRAIEVAGRLLAGRAGVVVHAWEPVFHRSLAARALAAAHVEEVREIVALLHGALADSASATTQEGVVAARAAGLDAAGDTVQTDDGAWRAVAAAARTHGAAVIATGTRGLGGARSALLGSVSSGLIHNAELPVLVVPAEEHD